MFFGKKYHRLVYMSLADGLGVNGGVGPDPMAAMEAAQNIAEQSVDAAEEAQSPEITETPALAAIDAERLHNSSLRDNEGRTVSIMSLENHPEKLEESSTIALGFLDLVESHSDPVYPGIDEMRIAVLTKFNLEGKDESMDETRVNFLFGEIENILAYVKERHKMETTFSKELTELDDSILGSLSAIQRNISNNFREMSPANQSAVIFGAAALSIYLAFKMKDEFKSLANTLLIGGIVYGVAHYGSQLLTGNTLAENLSGLTRGTERKLGEYLGLDPENQEEEHKIAAFSALVGINGENTFSRSNFSMSDLYSLYTSNNTSEAPVFVDSYFGRNQGSLSLAMEVFMAKFGPGSDNYENPVIREYMDNIIAGESDVSPRQAILDLITFDESAASILLGEASGFESDYWDEYGDAEESSDDSAGDDEPASASDTNGQADPDQGMTSGAGSTQEESAVRRGVGAITEGAQDLMASAAGAIGLGRENDDSQAESTPESQVSIPEGSLIQANVDNALLGIVREGRHSPLDNIPEGEYITAEEINIPPGITLTIKSGTRFRTSDYSSNNLAYIQRTFTNNPFPYNQNGEIFRRNRDYMNLQTLRGRVLITEDITVRSTEDVPIILPRSLIIDGQIDAYLS